MSKKHRTKIGASVCVKNQAGHITRIKKTEAAVLVEKGSHAYCSKSEWRAATRPKPKEEK
jgi:hypothetical protein